MKTFLTATLLVGTVFDVCQATQNGELTGIAGIVITLVLSCIPCLCCCCVLIFATRFFVGEARKRDAKEKKDLEESRDLPHTVTPYPSNSTYM